MKEFLCEDFLLQTETAKRLYHEYAEKMPIIDYHCHLPPNEIAENKKFENLTQISLYGDHYKWRAMRTNGVAEKYCTGNATDFEKFEKWAETVPYTMRNPLYHWTHMELKNYFGIQKLLKKDTAKEIYTIASEQLGSSNYRVRDILKKSKVEIICTTDDPADSLEFHKQIKQSGFDVKIFPTFRPDASMAVEDPTKYNFYIQKLEKASESSINSFSALIEALEKRHDYFHSLGCRLSDHGLETMYAEDYTLQEISTIFEKVRSGKVLVEIEILKFKSALLEHFALMDHAKGWVQQFHIGALRNNNSRLLKHLGPDTGWDSIGDFTIGKAMSKFFDKLDKENKLTKTILYNLNPRDNEMFATMTGNFNDGSSAGKIQFGSAWWFLDQKDGMEKQLNVISNFGLLSRFVGMLTDSRSFLSYTRHEYFRRILCNLLGNDVECGELPNDIKWLGQMVENICYSNAKNYFPFFNKEN